MIARDRPGPVASRDPTGVAMTRPLSVIVADDDPFVRHLFTSWLGHLGHRVRAVENGTQMLNAFRDSPAELIVSDLDMPGLCGIDALKQIPGVPAILVSAGWTPEHVVAADARGAIRLTKPAQMLDFVAAVNQATRLSAELATIDPRTTFLATLAHELRNALGPVINYAEMLRMKQRDPVQAELADRNYRQVIRLARLVDDLVDTSRVCMGKVSLERRLIDFRDVINEAVQGVGAVGRRLVVGLPEEPVWVDGDPDRLNQVVVNLLSNAVKFTTQEKRIEVSLTAIDGHATMRVRDFGVGIAPDRLDAVFDLFTQEQRSIEHSPGGLGIGLAVVRELITQHGGRVHAESDGDGRGSVFIVRLPTVG